MSTTNNGRPGKMTPRGLHWNRPAKRVVVQHAGNYTSPVPRKKAVAKTVDPKLLQEAADRRRAWRERGSR